MARRLPRLVLVILLAVVSGGMVVALVGPPTQPGLAGSAYPSTQTLGGYPGGLNFSLGLPAYVNANGNSLASSGTTVISTTATSSYATSHTQPVTSGSPSATAPAPNLRASNASRSIEFLSNVTLNVESPASALDQASSIAYSLGGYVAYSTEGAAGAYVVLRVPAASFQEALSRVKSLGTVVSAVSSSNDVTVKYTDLNATLDSLVAEQSSLLKLLGQSTSINSTLSIESMLQQVNAEVNQVQSQILQTRRLIDYATISADLVETQAAVPLSLKLAATPRAGMSPLSVTFNAAVTGGTLPYIVNYNFGDGTSAQGRTLIHTFVQPGNFNVTATVTDSSGNVSEAWEMVSVSPSPVASGLGNFPALVGSLFLRVVEGIVEVAAVAVPIALAVIIVVMPIRRRLFSARKAGDDRPQRES